MPELHKTQIILIVGILALALVIFMALAVFFLVLYPVPGLGINGKSD